MIPQIEIVNLSYRYPNGTLALQDLNLQFSAGERVAIIGDNGAGKSTFLLHLNGCLLPDEGRVEIASIVIEAKSLPEIRQRVGMVFQDADDQLFLPTVSEDVAFGPENLGFSPEQVEQTVRQTLEDLGIGHLADRSPRFLSGGEKRLVTLACVLAMKPEILAFDEPAANLAPKAKKRLLAILDGLEQTLFFATHDLEFAFSFCNRVIVLHKGCLLADEQADCLLQQTDILEKAGLEPSQIKKYPKI